MVTRNANPRSGLPTGATFSNGTFTWTPGYEQAGTYTITVAVTDGDATVTQEVTITVENLNRVPSADAQSVTTDEDNAVAITLTGSDPDGQSLTYTVTAQPTNGTLSGTVPNRTVGSSAPQGPSRSPTKRSWVDVS